MLNNTRFQPLRAIELAFKMLEAKDQTYTICERTGLIKVYVHTSEDTAVRRLIRVQADQTCQIQSALTYLFGMIPFYLEQYQMIWYDTKVVWYERFSELANPNPQKHPLISLHPNLHLNLHLNAAGPTKPGVKGFKLI